MTWVRIDDNYPSHPKVVTVGPIGAYINIRAICYCGRHLTDGFIPAGAVPELVSGFEHIGIETGGVPDMFAVGADVADFDWPAELVAVGLWEIKPGGYYVHDYLEYNASKSEVLDLREKRSAAGRRGGKATKSKANWGQANATAKEQQTGGVGVSKSRTEKEASKQQAREVLHFLNEKAGRSYRENATNLGLIEARLRSGATVANCKGVIARKAREWILDPKMAKYLRPETLFNATKFESYLGEREPDGAL